MNLRKWNPQSYKTHHSGYKRDFFIILMISRIIIFIRRLVARCAFFILTILINGNGNLIVLKVQKLYLDILDYIKVILRGLISIDFSIQRME